MAMSFVYLTGFVSLVIVHAFWFRIYTCWGHLKNVNFFSFWTCGNCYAKIGFMWTGLLDCEAECGQDGLFDWGSFGDNLPYRKELYWGMSSRYTITSWEPYKTNFATCSFQFDVFFYKILFFWDFLFLNRWFVLIQLDVDIGSSSVAKGVVNLVLGYLSKLVIELAFLIQVFLPTPVFHAFICVKKLVICRVSTLYCHLGKGTAGSELY